MTQTQRSMPLIRILFVAQQETCLAHELPRLCPVAHVVDFYREVLRALQNAERPFLIGGTYAMARYTHIDRATKDVDLMIRKSDWRATAHALRAAGIYTRLPFPHWLGKAVHGKAQVDIIFSSGNAVAAVDDVWFDRAVPAKMLGFNVRLCPPEELIWSKSFVMERERFDGADVLHLVKAMGGSLDWRHLCSRFGGHERVLLAHLTLFGYVYPDEASIVPDWVMRRLQQASIASPHPGVRLCRGPLLSRAQYLVDIEKWGYTDARLLPYGTLSERDNRIWTRGIREHWSRGRTARAAAQR